MAPAQIVDLPQTKTVYTHKKFQVKRYSHKKFGIRSPPPPANQTQLIYEHQDRTQFIMGNQIANCNEITTIKKKSKGDIFRPYALEDKSISRKRKHQELQDEGWQQHTQMNGNIDAKRFAASPPNAMTNMPGFLPPTPVHFPYMPPLFHRLQQYQFNAQTFAIVLQKQQAALCLGEMLKRQPNFNMYNLIGN